MNRKVAAAILTLAVIFSATAAFANDGTAKCPKQGRAEGRHERMKRPPMSAEQREQFEKIRKLEDELRTELEKSTPDKAKARALNKQIVDLRCDESAKRFEKMLSRGKPKDCPKPTEAQKARMKKMDELRGAIRAELEKDTPDKARATALHNELLNLRKEAETERFEQMLQNPKKFCGKGDFHHGDGPMPRPEGEF